MDMASLRILSFAPLTLGVTPWFLRVMSDASSEGWGIVLPQSMYAGRLDASILQTHVVPKEMLTYSGLTASSESLSYFTLTPWLLCFLRCGYSRAIHLDRLARVTWQLVSRRALTLHLSFLPGNCNVRADQLSRGVTISTEWSISDTDYKTLLHLAGFGPG